MSNYSLYVLAEWWRSWWIHFKWDELKRIGSIWTDYLVLEPVIFFYCRFYLGFPTRFWFRLVHFGAVDSKYVIWRKVCDYDRLNMWEVMSNLIRKCSFSHIAKIILQVFIWQCKLKFLLVAHLLQLSLQFLLKILV